jgi:hypothetical protein
VAQYYLRLNSAITAGVYFTYGANTYSVYAKWNVTYTQKMTKNCDKLYFIQNSFNNEYLHANNSHIYTTGRRRYLFTSPVSNYDLINLKDYGNLWIIKENPINGYFIYNYLTYEHAYLRSDVGLSWIRMLAGDWVYDDSSRNFTLIRA